MNLTQEQLDGLLADGNKGKYNIILIGMSSSGKTHWAKALAKEYSMEHVEYDELIGKSNELSKLLKGIKGKDEAERMGKYFGMPWTEGFQGRENKFLVIESAAMENDFGTGKVLDLTGSAIYHPEQLERLAKTGIVIYLETSEEAQEAMFRTFLSEPKPVCWKGQFNQKEGENVDDALKRCYPNLLATRANLYSQFANLTIPSGQHKKFEDAIAFMSYVKAVLSKAI